MEEQAQKKTESISFRTTPAVKMKLAARATSLHMDMSEYIHAAVLDHQEMMEQNQAAKTDAERLRQENRGLLAQAQELAEKVLTKDREKQIREAAIREFQEKQIKNGLKSPYIEVNKDLKRRVDAYETLALKAIFDKVRGQVARIGMRKVTINDLPDLVAVLADVYQAQEAGVSSAENSKGGAQ